MIYVSCNGAGKFEDLYVAITDFCAKSLGLPLHRSFPIDIDICNDIKENEEDDVEAYLDVDDDDNGGYAYTIMIDKGLSVTGIMQAICHEMIHVHQYERGDLYYDKDENVYWKGKKINENRYKHYQNIPWEKEAYAKETLLFEMFLQAIVKPYIE